MAPRTHAPDVELAARAPALPSLALSQLLALALPCGGGRVAHAAAGAVEPTRRPPQRRSSSRRAPAGLAAGARHARAPRRRAARRPRHADRVRRRRRAPVARRASAASPSSCRRRARRSSRPRSTACMLPGFADRISIPFGLAARPLALVRRSTLRAGGRGSLAGIGVQLGVTVEHLRTSDDRGAPPPGCTRRSPLDVPLYGGARGRAAWRCACTARLMVTPARHARQPARSAEHVPPSGQLFAGLAYYPVSAAQPRRRAASWRSGTIAWRRWPRRWAWRWRARRSRRTSRSGATTRARSSTRAGGWWRRRRTSRCTSARRRCRCGGARAR